jgi:uncharacterized protein involved in exopolysaccharide biosynthesis
MSNALQVKPVRNADARSTDDTDFLSFVEYLRGRWVVAALACGVALAVTGLGSLLMPKRYTATASILIEPPAGNDPRGNTAISPVYLESLRTYEHFASSDSLFEQALKDLQFREVFSGIPIETLKHRILKVSKLRDTKILEIRATLDTPQQAQSFAHYIAEHTAAMNRELEAISVQELSQATQYVVDIARRKLEAARQARDIFISQQPITPLETKVANESELKSRVDRELMEGRVDLAAYRARLKGGASQPSHQNSSEGVEEAAAAADAQVQTLVRQSQELSISISADTALLERRKHQREILDKELQTAQSQYETETTRNNEVLASAVFRGERLAVVDPGVVPERPSSPNIPVNLAVSLIGSLTISVLYLAIAFSYARASLMRCGEHRADT